jgi:hypothetical protein
MPCRGQLLDEGFGIVPGDLRRDVEFGAEARDDFIERRLRPSAAFQMTEPTSFRLNRRGVGGAT